MPHAELVDLVQRLGFCRDRLTSQFDSGGSITAKFDVDPYDFLLQAEEDFAAGSDSAYLNAITNAKRAIVGQMDQILFSFGFRSNRMNIPDKIQALGELGVVFPRILKRVSGARNMLEHEYVRPSEEQVCDALDLASLFVASSKPTTEMFCQDYSVGHFDSMVTHWCFEYNLAVSFTPDKATFNVCATDNTGKRRSVLGKTSIENTDPSYSPLARLAIATSTDFRVDAAIQYFADAAGIPK